MKLWRIILKGACFGLLVEQGVVVEAAPICGWATGQRWGKVKRWLASKGGHGSVVDEVM
jgi:hypothetical protein